jgi:hypothetical protein
VSWASATPTPTGASRLSCIGPLPLPSPLPVGVDVVLQEQGVAFTQTVIAREERSDFDTYGRRRGGGRGAADGRIGGRGRRVRAVACSEMVPQTEEPAARGATSALVDVEAEPPIKKTCTKQPDGGCACARVRAARPPARPCPVPATLCRAVQASTPLRSWGGA